MTSGETLTRADLSNIVYRKLRLSRADSAVLVQLFLKEVSASLVRGEHVKLSGFGSFIVRNKGRRIGRNPKTGEQVPIEPRRIVAFRSSKIMKARINNKKDDS